MLNQEVHRRQKLDQVKTDSLERMLEDLGERERRLQSLSAEAEKSSKIRKLQEKKVKKEIHQVKAINIIFLEAMFSKICTSVNLLIENILWLLYIPSFIKKPLK